MWFQNGVCLQQRIFRQAKGTTKAFLVRINSARRTLQNHSHYAQCYHFFYFWCSPTYKHENLQLNGGNFSLQYPVTQNTHTDVLINSHKSLYRWHRTFKRRLWFNLPVMKTDFSTRSRIHQLRGVTHDMKLRVRTWKKKKVMIQF